VQGTCRWRAIPRISSGYCLASSLLPKGEALGT
jgi:hypothetical protein